MARFLLHGGSLCSRKDSVRSLAFIFLAGIVAGCILYFSAEFDSVSWMRGALYSPVSIVGLLSVILLPFLFSVFAAMTAQHWMLLLIVFCKAVSFAQVACGITVAFGSAGWLMRSLLMFTDIFSLPVLLLFWLRYWGGRRRLTVHAALAYLAVLVSVGGIDILFISPILAGL